MFCTKQLLSNYYSINCPRLSNLCFRSKCNSAVYENAVIKYHCFNNARDFKLNGYLRSKLSRAKDVSSRQQIIKTILTMNPGCKLNNFAIDVIRRSSLNKESMKKIEPCEKKTSIASTKIEDKTKNYESTQLGSISRPIRREEPGEVIWGFIPKEWAAFFVPITGHSGFYTLLVTLGTYLFSKEIYVCDHDYYNGISLVILCIYIVKTQGSKMAKALDKEIDNYERNLNLWKELLKENLRNAIISEVKGKESMEAQLIVVDAKRENVHLQREAEFRRRQMEVYEEVTRILNYQVEQENVRRTFQKKNLIQWVTKEVEKGLTSELKEKYMKMCLEEINEIIKRGMK